MQQRSKVLWLSINYDSGMETKLSLNGHQIRSERSTRLLLRAAGDLVAEGGYQSMTLATVGEHAGYSRSLATARFGSKAKLLEALVDEIVVRWDVETVEPELRERPTRRINQRIAELCSADTSSHHGQCCLPDGPPAQPN